MTAGSCGGLFASSATASAGEFTVFPHPPSLTQPALPPDLHTRIGDHVDRQPGEGVEFAGVRPSTLPWTGNERRMPRHPSHSIGKAQNTRFSAALMGARADETDAHSGGSVLVPSDQLHYSA